MDGPEDGDRR